MTTLKGDTVPETLEASMIYVAGMTVDEYLDHMANHHPEMAQLLDPERLAAAGAQEWVAGGNEFDDDDTGRGVSYRSAQRHTGARSVGIRTLFGLLGGPEPDTMGTVLDVLGGEGLLSRVWRDEMGVGPDSRVPLMTGDISAGMVGEALRDRLPAVRQRADQLLLRDESVDGVLIAYGTHHIDRTERQAMADEALRVLRPGGRVVVHDFDEGSPVSRWFAEVVHPWSQTGHEYDHFTAPELRVYLESAGFEEVRVDHMYDPVILSAPSEAEAHSLLVAYMASMYGLDPEMEPRGEQLETELAVDELILEIFRYEAAVLAHVPDAVTEVTVRQCADGTWVAELPRVALVASGKVPVTS